MALDSATISDSLSPSLSSLVALGQTTQPQVLARHPAPSQLQQYVII